MAMAGSLACMVMSMSVGVTTCVHDFCINNVYTHGQLGKRRDSYIEYIHYQDPQDVSNSASNASCSLFQWEKCVLDSFLIQTELTQFNSIAAQH